MPGKSGYNWCRNRKRGMCNVESRLLPIYVEKHVVSLYSQKQERFLRMHTRLEMEKTEGWHFNFPHLYTVIFTINVVRTHSYLTNISGDLANMHSNTTSVRNPVDPGRAATYECGHLGGTGAGLVPGKSPPGLQPHHTLRPDRLFPPPGQRAGSSLSR